MEQFAKRSDTERQDILQESANRRGIRDVIIEKDFWVCWTLGRLYALPELADHIIFKGGTSLSKAYGLIERFSEDIDLTIGRTAPHICDTKNPMESDISRKERERRITTVKSAAQCFVAEVAMPLLNTAFSKSLGTNEGWTLSLDEEDSDQQTLLFHYPRVMNYRVGGGFFGARFFAARYFAARHFTKGKIGYIKPAVKLEFGARGETEPHESRVIQPYVAEDFPDFFEQPNISILTLAAERTFWEKATILHALHHGSKLRDRMSRHYYDTFIMAEKGIAEIALSQPELLQQVVHNKNLMFRDNKASYETATMAELKLIPTDDMFPALQKDYDAMQEMLMGDVPDFNAIMKRLAALEEQIHKAK